MKIKDIKDKILTAMGDIDLSKVTLQDLKLYVDTVVEVEKLAKEPDPDFYKVYSKLCDTIAYAPKAPTLNEMKGE
jgi:hypothetical protein